MKIKYPSVIQYLDLSLYLKDIYEFNKNNMPNFSYESWADDLKIKSRSYLRLIVTGKRPLSDEVANQLIDYLCLNSKEAIYFSILAKYSETTSVKTRERYAKILAEHWNESLQIFEVQNTEPFLMDTLAPQVFTYLSFKDTQKTLKAIRQNFNIEIERAHQIILNLKQAELIRVIHTIQGELEYQTLHEFFKVPDQNSHEFIKKFHLEGLTMAEKAQDLPFEVRRYRSLMFALSTEQMSQAQELINEFAEKVLKRFQTENALGKNIYRLNLQLFPTSRNLE